MGGLSPVTHLSRSSSWSFFNRTNSSNQQPVVSYLKVSFHQKKYHQLHKMVIQGHILSTCCRLRLGYILIPQFSRQDNSRKIECLTSTTDFVSSYFCLFITLLYHHVCLTQTHFYWDVSQIRVRILGSLYLRKPQFGEDEPLHESLVTTWNE